jgi:hypothetical protein
MMRRDKAQGSRPIWKHADRLALGSKPYSIVAAPGLDLPAKRYLHVPAHGSHTASRMLEAVHDASDLPAPGRALLDFWNHIEAGTPPYLSAGAIQVRNAPGPMPSGLSAKAYFKPRLLPGMGIRPAASALVRAIEKTQPGPGREMIDEIVRRHGIEEIFYIACGLRPDLEVETYHDVEFRRGDYGAGEIREIARGLAHHDEIARCAERCVALAEGSPMACNHISCDLWPLDGGGVTVVLTALDEPGARRSDQMELICAIAGLEGSMSPVPRRVEDIEILAGMHPSVVAVKIAPVAGVVRHALLVEEVDPEFAELL